MEMKIKKKHFERKKNYFHQKPNLKELIIFNDEDDVDVDVDQIAT